MDDDQQHIGDDGQAHHKFNIHAVLDNSTKHYEQAVTVRAAYFIRRAADPEGWIQTLMITHVEGDPEDMYLFSRKEKIDQVLIDKRLAEGEILEIPGHPVIDKNDCIWIKSNGDVILANNENPLLNERFVINDFISKYKPG